MDLRLFFQFHSFKIQKQLVIGVLLVQFFILIQKKLLSAPPLPQNKRLSSQNPLSLSSDCGKPGTHVKEFTCKKRGNGGVLTFRQARVNLSEITEIRESYFSRTYCCATPILPFLPPVVSGKPFLTKDLADERVVACCLSDFSG